MSKAKTQQSGAQQERDAIRAFLRRRKAAYEREESVLDDRAPRMVRASEEVGEILDWLGERAARFRREAGGLGRAKGRQ